MYLGLNVPTFCTGRIYSGQFTEDDQWYRVKVDALSVDPPSGISPPLGSSVLVTYLDFGNSEWLPASRMRTLPEGLDSVPPLAKPCSLADIMPSGKVMQQMILKCCW